MELFLIPDLPGWCGELTHLDIPKYVGLEGARFVHSEKARRTIPMWVALPVASNVAGLSKSTMSLPGQTGHAPPRHLSGVQARLKRHSPEWEGKWDRKNAKNNNNADS